LLCLFGKKNAAGNDQYGMRNDIMAGQRHRAAPLASVRVLEIGRGAALNRPLLGSDLSYPMDEFVGDAGF